MHRQPKHLCYKLMPIAVSISLFNYKHHYAPRLGLDYFRRARLRPCSSVPSPAREVLGQCYKIGPGLGIAQLGPTWAMNTRSPFSSGMLPFNHPSVGFKSNSYIHSIIGSNSTIILMMGFTHKIPCRGPFSFLAIELQ